MSTSEDSYDITTDYSEEEENSQEEEENSSENNNSENNDSENNDSEEEEMDEEDYFNTVIRPCRELLLKKRTKLNPSEEDKLRAMVSKYGYRGSNDVEKCSEVVKKKLKSQNFQGDTERLYGNQLIMAYDKFTELRKKEEKRAKLASLVDSTYSMIMGSEMDNLSYVYPGCINPQLLEERFLYFLNDELSGRTAIVPEDYYFKIISTVVLDDGQVHLRFGKQNPSFSLFSPGDTEANVIQVSPILYSELKDTNKEYVNVYACSIKPFAELTFKILLNDYEILEDEDEETISQTLLNSLRKLGIANVGDIINLKFDDRTYQYQIRKILDTDNNSVFSASYPSADTRISVEITKEDLDDIVERIYVYISYHGIKKEDIKQYLMEKFDIEA